jgi:dihydrolipoamide dehydrogenase
MAEPDFDLAVIGGGPGGYVASLRAAQLGMSVVCIDRRASLGGTCLNVGCIPSKALLRSSEIYAEASHGFASHGVNVGEVSLDLAAMMARKDDVVGKLAGGVGSLLKKAKIHHDVGTGRIVAAGRIEVLSDDGSTHAVSATRIIIATGSDSIEIPSLPIDEKQIVTSTGALALERVPEKMVVVGAGAIGLELGSVWSRLGAKVTVVEILDHILPGMDREIGKAAQRSLKKQGLDFQLETRVTGSDAHTAGITLQTVPVAGGDASELEADVVLVAVGRRPHTEGLGLDELGVTRDERGFIQIDEAFQTSVAGIHAIGDCVPGPMLAHKAEEDGVACVETMAGQRGHVDYGRVPGVVYTSPEVAAVGRTQEELEAEGVSFSVGKFPFAANSRARISGETDGMVKILADAATDRVLGVHIVGPLAGDLIAEAVAALEFGASAEDIARTCHAHPSVAEAIKEAALAVDGRPLHV